MVQKREMGFQLDVGGHAGIVGPMNVADSIARGLDWLATPRQLTGRLEMETRRGRRLELEVVSFRVKLPLAGGAVVRIPVFMMVMPAGSSPVEGTDVHSGEGRD